MNFATPDKAEAPLKVAKKTTRRSARLSNDDSSKQAAAVNGSYAEAADPNALDLVGGQQVEERRPERSDASLEVTKIALPYTDTPVINRNKELRRKTGNRRSSLGLRGRRASSLIENGHSAIPHHEVETSQFYKHIEADGLSEPRRMKQLLTWCGERALGAKPSHNISDAGAVLAGKLLFPSRSKRYTNKPVARAIQEQILKDFATMSQMSDWFSRDEAPQKKIVIKKPNPRNVENAAKITELEERVQK
jgi:kinetochore protein Mis13/DSN1